MIRSNRRILAIPAPGTLTFSTRDVRLGSLQQLREVTECEFGKLAPVGSLFGLPLLLDWDLLAEDEIYLNPAPLMMSMAVEPSDSRALENHSATEPTYSCRSGTRRAAGPSGRSPVRVTAEGRAGGGASRAPVLLWQPSCLAPSCTPPTRCSTRRVTSSSRMDRAARRWKRSPARAAPRPGPSTIGSAPGTS